MTLIEELVQSLAPEPNEARVFVLNPADPMGEIIRATASGDDLKRCEKIQDLDTRDSALTGAGLLRIAAAALTGDDVADVSIVRDVMGRPSIRGHERSQLDINMSRRVGCVAVLVSRGSRCGVDIERVVAGAEHAQILDALKELGVEVGVNTSGDSIYRRWCAIEAVLKADGRGLRDGVSVLDRVSEDEAIEKWRCDGETWVVRAIPIEGSYVGAVALGEGVRLRCLSMCFEGIEVTSSV
jgi:phosphopantetheinyl transferase